MRTATELVLVIPRAVLMDDPGWLGVRTDGLDAFEDLVNREAATCRARARSTTGRSSR